MLDRAANGDTLGCFDPADGSLAGQNNVHRPSRADRPFDFALPSSKSATMLGRRKVELDGASRAFLALGVPEPPCQVARAEEGQLHVPDGDAAG